MLAAYRSQLATGKKTILRDEVLTVLTGVSTIDDHAFTPILILVSERSHLVAYITVSYRARTLFR